MGDMEEDIQYPSHFSSTIASVVGIFEDYGWYILISGVIMAYLYQRYLRTIVDHYRIKRDEAEYAAKYHKNPDLVTARLTAQEQRTLQLQEKYRRDAEEHKRKIEEKEAKKREALLNKYSEEGGHKLGASNNDENKSFKPGEKL
ncbi:unnamed protein product [Phaedon cochleariae]|uniref:Selenoprotein S n=1 Tax=Phaedon cochleariae TaxID=80249 RepID=A0A9P0DGX9_PHACE|nr:unnamed protein product [Phaedon cochleariae]